MIIEGKSGRPKNLEIKKSGTDGIEFIIYYAGENSVKTIIVDKKDLLICLRELVADSVPSEQKEKA